MNFPWKLVLGILGNLCSLALYLSPMPTFWSIFKQRSTQEFSGLPYVCTLFTCALWLLYGTPYVKPNSLLILTVNGTGFLLELFYLMAYLAFSAKRRKVMIMRLILAMSLAFATVVVITLLVVQTYVGRQLFAGTLCVILSIAMYASPLSIMGLVIRTRSVEYMPFLLSLFNFINAVVWSAYSVATRDIFIAIPNGVGCLCGIIQLSIYGLYKGPKQVFSTRNELPQLKSIETTNVSTIHKVHDEADVSTIHKVHDEAIVPTKVSSPRLSSVQRISSRVDPVVVP